MIELGKKQELTVIKKTDFGIYLGEEPGAAERVLLPKKQVPEERQPEISLRFSSTGIPKTD